MKRIVLTLLTAISVILVSCKGKPITTENIETAKIENDNTKDISDYKLALLDEDFEKAQHILGRPDTESFTILNGGFYLYYNKVKENGRVKHLLVHYEFNENRRTYETKKIEAIDNYGAVNLRGFPVFRATYIKPQHVDAKANLMEQMCNNFDTVRNSPQIDRSEAPKVKKCWRFRDNQILIKVNFPLSDGDYSIKQMFFYNNKIRFILEKDNRHWLVTKKSYIENNRVIKYTEEGKITSCEKTDACIYDEFSVPYRLLKSFNDSDVAE
jgi:hypothetical protein